MPQIRFWNLGLGVDIRRSQKLGGWLRLNSERCLWVAHLSRPGRDPCGFVFARVGFFSCSLFQFQISIFPLCSFCLLVSNFPSLSLPFRETAVSLFRHEQEPPIHCPVTALIRPWPPIWRRVGICLTLELIPSFRLIL